MLMNANNDVSQNLCIYVSVAFCCLLVAELVSKERFSFDSQEFWLKKVKASYSPTDAHVIEMRSG